MCSRPGDQCVTASRSRSYERENSVEFSLGSLAIRRNKGVRKDKRYELTVALVRLVLVQVEYAFL